MIRVGYNNMNESVNPFKGMKKVKMSDAEWDKARKTGAFRPRRRRCAPRAPLPRSKTRLRPGP